MEKKKATDDKKVRINFCFGELNECGRRGVRIKRGKIRAGGRSPGGMEKIDDRSAAFSEDRNHEFA